MRRAKKTEKNYVLLVAKSMNKLRRELSAELRAELYKELLDAANDEKLRDPSQGEERHDFTEDSDETNVKRLSNTH